MKKLLIVLTLLSGAAFAQSTKVPSVDGNPVSGDCVKWTSGRTLGSTGTPCNSGTGFSMDIPSPALADSGVYQHKVARQYTIQRISCSTDVGTVSINFDIRNESSPNDPGNPVLSASLVCSSGTASTVTFANAVVFANSPVALIVTATNGTPSVVRVHVYTQIQ
jgi:hypothetical protein